MVVVMQQIAKKEEKPQQAQQPKQSAAPKKPAHPLQIAQLKGHTDEVTGAAVSPDGSVLCTLFCLLQ